MPTYSTCPLAGTQTKPFRAWLAKVGWASRRRSQSSRKGLTRFSFATWVASTGLTCAGGRSNRPRSAAHDTSSVAAVVRMMANAMKFDTPIPIKVSEFDPLHGIGPLVRRPLQNLAHRNNAYVFRFLGRLPEKKVGADRRPKDRDSLDIFALPGLNGNTR